jgi:hypothetical protein
LADCPSSCAATICLMSIGKKSIGILLVHGIVLG